MATFRVGFLGCKVSFADAQEVRERLLADGHAEAEGAADVAVLSTCCVTHEAVRKSRKAARRASRRAGRVLLTGCGANLAGAFTGLPENVTVVALPSEQTASHVAATVGTVGCVEGSFGSDRIRAFVKIQDGCSFGCSFCVVPRVRGTSRSRSADALLDEIRRRVGLGHREVVLTGINLGCYRDRTRRLGLAGLVRAAAQTPGLQRLRLSSVEVNHLTEELLSAMREEPVVTPHLHVPLQSGDDRVLAAMRRRYTAASFLRRIEVAEGFNLTTDVIVGFPEEDEAAFDRTLALLARVGFTKIHVFPYSPRPGTATGVLDPVPPHVKRERSARVGAASREACRRAWRRKLGCDDLVLVDRPGRGYGSDYTPWLVDAPVGDFVRARARAVVEAGVVG